MDKGKIVEEIMQKLPDGSRIVFAEITVLTEDFQTLNYIAVNAPCADCNFDCRNFKPRQMNVGIVLDDDGF